MCMVILLFVVALVYLCVYFIHNQKKEEKMNLYVIFLFVPELDKFNKLGGVYYYVNVIIYYT